MGGEQKRESVVSMSQTNSNFQSDAFGLVVRRDGLQKEENACVAKHDACHQQNMHD